MLYLVVFLFISVLFITLSFIMKIKVVAEYTRYGENDDIAFSLYSLGGLIKYKVEVPMADLSTGGLKIKRIIEKGKKEKDIDRDKGKFSFNDIYQKIIKMREFYNEHYEIINKIKCYLTKKVIMNDFTLDVRLGAGDAFYTGMLTGGIWTLAGTLASYLSNNFSTKHNCVNIKPNFYEKELTIDIFCIFETKIAHIIVVLLMLLKQYLEFKQKLKRKVIGGGIVG